MLIFNLILLLNLCITNAYTINNNSLNASSNSSLLLSTSTNHGLSLSRDISSINTRSTFGISVSTHGAFSSSTHGAPSSNTYGASSSSSNTHGASSSSSSSSYDFGSISTFRYSSISPISSMYSLQASFSSNYTQSLPTKTSAIVIRNSDNTLPNSSKNYNESLTSFKYIPSYTNTVHNLSLIKSSIPNLSSSIITSPITTKSSSSKSSKSSKSIMNTPYPYWLHHSHYSVDSSMDLITSKFNDSSIEHGYYNTNTNYSATAIITSSSTSSEYYNEIDPTPDYNDNNNNNPFMSLLYTSPCSNGNAEITGNMQFGWKGTSNTGFGWVVSDMVNDLINNAGDNDFTASTARGGLKCGMWSGAMVSNHDTLEAIVNDIRENLHGQDIPTGKYFEYVSDDKNPMKTIGIYCQVNSNSDDVAAALRGWSEGKSASESVQGVSGHLQLQPTNGNSKQSICYKGYSNRKTGNSANDNTPGKCDVKTLSAGQTATSLCGVPGDSLTYYNKGMDFSSLSEGDTVCCSIGDGSVINLSFKCNEGSTKLTPDIAFGWQNTELSSYSWVIADMVQDISNKLNNNPSDFTEFTQRGGLMCGTWFGSMISISDTTSSILSAVRTNIKNEGMPTAKYFEYIGDNPMKTFGIYCSANGNLDDVRTAVKGWSQGKSAWNTVGGLTGTYTIHKKAVCFLDYSKRRSGNVAPDPNIGTCNYNRISSGQSASTACNGLTGDVLSSYNPNVNINQVQPKQPICCSIGSMPDFRPKQNSDGSCFEHTFQDGDTCAAVMAQYYPLSEQDLMDYNKNTFNWLGCSNGHPWKGDKICLSSGTPPRPTVNPQAECGPQSPNYNAECPLNACCSMYGFCGLTSEFCATKQSLTNAPGTTGCMSNCNSVQFSGQSNEWTNIAYFDATKDASVLDYDSYDVIHMAFANVNGLSIDTSNIKSNYDDFKYIKAKKVLSIGGWDFSTGGSTYSILRNAIENNYDSFANSIVSFMQQPENSFLDGFDIDWEYPGEPDIPGIPADSKDAGNKYYELVKAVRLRMDRSKTLSMAIPSSYWYLKNFPIKEMSEYVDYFVFMTYDLHGQWDYGEKFSGGPYTRCHTDLPETVDALKLIVKAGVPEAKVRVGTANYARSYKLIANSNCNGDGCEFTGPQSGAKAGQHTNTPGILSITEIREIVADQSRVNSEFNNATSGCTYLRYDGDQWAAWTTENSVRQSMYKSLGFGGTSLWVANYEKSSTSDSDDNDDNGDDDDSDYSGDGYDDDLSSYVPEIYQSYLDINCYTQYKDIATEQEFNASTPECITSATVAYLINSGKKAVDYLKTVIDGGDDHDEYLKDYTGFSNYFSKNISYAYQQWSYANMNNEDWFSCLDSHGNSIGCKYAYDNNFDAPCADNCCQGVGCTKSVDGTTYEDTKKETGSCLTDSYLTSCCDRSNIYPATNKLSTIKQSYQDHIINIGLKRSTVNNNIQTNAKPIKYENSPNIDNYLQQLIINNTLELIDTGKLKESHNISIDDNNGVSTAVLQPRGDTTGNKGKTHIAGWIVKNEDAFKDFSKYCGYNVNASVMYIQPFYRFQEPIQYFSNDDKSDPNIKCWKDSHGDIIVKCYDIPADQKLHTDPIAHMSLDFLQNITDVLNSAASAAENNEDYMIDIYESLLEPISSIVDTQSYVESLRSIGHNYNYKCEMVRIEQIIGPILFVLGILTMFLGPELALAADLALAIVGIATNPDENVESIIESLAGAFMGVFGVIGRADKGRFAAARGALRTGKRLDNAASRTLSLLKTKASKELC